MAKRTSTQPAARTGRREGYSSAVPNFLNNMTKASAIDDTWHPGGSALYVQVRAQIVEAIRTGEWKPGTTIPPERKLCERFRVSIGTLRKAVDELTTSGILVRRQGRGTYVAKHSEGRYLFSFFHLARLDGQKEYPSVRFHQFRTTHADAFAASALEVDEGSALWHLTNVLSLAGNVVCVDDIYLPKHHYPSLKVKTLKERDTTLYQLYQDQFGIAIVRTQECVRACLADAPYTELLGVKKDSPLLNISRTAYSLENWPVELRISYANSERCRYCPTASSQP